MPPSGTLSKAQFAHPPYALADLARFDGSAIEALRHRFDSLAPWVIILQHLPFSGQRCDDAEEMSVLVNRPISRLAAVFLAALPFAQPPSAMARETAALAAASADMPEQAAIQAFYKRWQGPAWFKDGDRAAAELATILRRAALEGLTNGPTLARQVEQATQAALTGGPADKAAAERVLSAAWVAYVETVRRPTRDMIYAYPTLAPKAASAEQILTAAASAPSLERHLAEISTVNPLYAELRDLAWHQMQSSAAAAPDPRIAINLERLRSLPASGQFALVNAATQRLQMYENGKPVDSMKVIVGMQQYPTPMISSVIYYATFNPYWNVPDHLVRKTIAPNVLKMGTAYLKSRGYQVMSDWTENATIIPSDRIDWKAVAAGQTKVRVRQLPGPQNSMGKLKFSFANGEDIYLHDTPSKALFAKPQRDLSNGCVRLEDAARFGRWLLGREPVAPSAEPEQFVQLPRGIPVYVTYLTAQPVDGKIVYSPDIYGRDAVSSAQAGMPASPDGNRRISAN